MSFFTSELLKTLVTDEFLKELVKNSAIDITDYLTDEVIDVVFSNNKVREAIRKIIIEILSDMNIKDEVDSDYCPCGVPPCGINKNER